MPLFGDVAIVNFPFSDGIQFKPRPALVLSTETDGDILFARITSKQYRSSGDFAIEFWRQAGLPNPSIVRLSKLVSLHPARVKRIIGTLAEDDQYGVIKEFHNFIDSLKPPKT